jgi:hypothetical protein
MPETHPRDRVREEVRDPARPGRHDPSCGSHTAYVRRHDDRVDNGLRNDPTARLCPLTPVRGCYIDNLYKDLLNTARLLPTEGEGCR